MKSPNLPSALPGIALDRGNDASLSSGLSQAAVLIAASCMIAWACVGLITMYDGKFLFLIPLFLAFLCMQTPRLFLVLVIVTCIAQNVFVALWSDSFKTLFTFQASQALNFMTTSIGGGIYLLFFYLKRQQLPRESRALIKLAFAYMVILFLYMVVGTLKTDAISALSYFRLFSVFLFTFVIGLYTGRRLNPATFQGVITLMSVFVIFWGVFEATSPEALYRIFNYDVFSSWKETGSGTSADARLMAQGNMRSWLNFTGQYRLDISLPQIYGPAAHVISYAYSMVFLATCQFYYRRYILASVLVLGAIYVGAKGPLILFVIPTILFLFLRQIGAGRNTLKLYLTVLGMYVAAVIAYGLASADVHVLGLLKGFSNLLQAPLGKGLGMGGNLSSIAKREYVAYQSTDLPFAVESAFGVMLYQIGIFAAALMLIVWRIRKVFVLELKPNPAILFATMVMMCLVCNSFFQEEALAPAAAGLYFLLFGVIVAHNRPPSRGRTGADASAAPSTSTNPEPNAS